MDVVVFNTGLSPQLKSDFIYGWREVVPTIKILEISEEPLIKSAAGIDMQKVGAPDAYLAIPFLIDELPAAIEALLPGDAIGNSLTRNRARPMRIKRRSTNTSTVEHLEGGLAPN